MEPKRYRIIEFSDGTFVQVPPGYDGECSPHRTYRELMDVADVAATQRRITPDNRFAIGTGPECADIVNPVRPGSSTNPNKPSQNTPPVSRTKP